MGRGRTSGGARALVVAGVLAAVALAPAAARAQLQPTAKVDPDAPSVSTRPDKSTVQLGEPFKVSITVLHPAKMLVNLPSTLNLPDAWTEFGDRDVITGTEPDGFTRTVLTFTVAALELGEQTFPAVQVGYQVAGELRQLDTLPFTVEVTSVVGKGQTELKPIAQPVRVLERDWTLLWVAGGVVGGGLLGFVGVRAIRAARRRSPRALAAAAAARVLPPDEAALQRLRALAASGKLDEEDRRPVYFELTEILREYLGRRYGFEALELTSEELVARLPRYAAAELVDGLGAWLSACDLIKYARVPASRDEAERALADAVALVERSRPPVEAPPASGEPGAGVGGATPGAGRAPAAPDTGAAGATSSTDPPPSGGA